MMSRLPSHLGRSTVSALVLAAGLAAQQPAAQSCIFFVGDGMGVSTVSAARFMSVGVDGNLVLDYFPHTAMSRTSNTDALTPDSAGTMTAMITGQNTNQGVVGLDKSTERGDFNRDGDGKTLMTILEMAKAAGKSVGVISTARITHATPAACYAKVNDRNKESEIALQALPTDATYNKLLGSGIDLIMGGGRRFFVPNTVRDEEGSLGARTDNRDLRDEFKKAGYQYIWNRSQVTELVPNRPILGLFESSHMEYEWDRPNDTGGELSLSEMTQLAILFLSQNPKGYFLMVESGRIDHAHHAGNAFRALKDTEELDQTIANAALTVDLSKTLLLVTADHSHVFNIAGYPLRPSKDLPYKPVSAPADYLNAPYNGIFNIVYSINSSGNIVAAGDGNSVPYTILGYLNGPGYRGVPRVNPLNDPFKGLGGATVTGPGDPQYLQEAAVPIGSETHAGEDVVIYGAGPGSERVRGTVMNTHSFEVMKAALGL